MTDVSVIILTRDEQVHIGRCLERLAPLVPRQVFVIDCFSSDATCEIAERLGALVVKHAWPGCQARQFNWALEKCPIEASWILRLDADEYLFPETIEELKRDLPAMSPSITSLSFPLTRIWQGKKMGHGTGRIILKRMLRRGKGRCEERNMDEHIVTFEGEDRLLSSGFADDNLQNLGWWTKKHIGYALREAVDLLQLEYGFGDAEKYELSGQAALKRAQKKKYARLPLFWRSFAYFLYRYFLKGGFLDGKEGFTWNFLQGWWYRTLVDAQILEIKRQAKGYVNLPNEAARIEAVLREQYGIH